MKTILTAISVVAAASFAVTATSEASPYGHEHDHGSSQAGNRNSGGHSHDNHVGFENPRYYKNTHYAWVVGTCEVSRCREKRFSNDRHGHPFTYYVTVITYEDHYSDGSTKRYKKYLYS